MEDVRKYLNFPSTVQLGFLFVFLYFSKKIWISAFICVQITAGINGVWSHKDDNIVF